MGEKKKKDNLQNGRILAGTATMENSMKIPQKTKNRITIGSSNHTRAYTQRNNSKIMQPYVHSSTIYDSQNMET